MIKAPIYPFLTGGLLVGGTKLVSDIASPLWASLLGAIPNDMITPYFLDTDSDKKIYIVLLAILTWFISSFYLVRYSKPYVKQYFTKNK
jgi:hypothetical protein